MMGMIQLLGDADGDVEGAGDRLFECDDEVTAAAT